MLRIPFDEPLDFAKTQGAGMMDGTPFGYWKASFNALGCPCELLVDTPDVHAAREAWSLALREIRRIEKKFSRYHDGSVVSEINASGGVIVRVDKETAGLLDLAAGLTERSDGRFDITCGILRRAWSFNGQVCEPDRDRLQALVRRVGWSKLSWHNPQLCLPAGMEIDLGGIGKEYAADRVAAMLSQYGYAALVNLGGDVVATGPRASGEPWYVGIESSTQSANAPVAPSYQLTRGALATSGDTHRYAVVGGRRLGHVLDPHTGWPLEDAPRAVTVRAETCSEAGALALLALLRQKDAERFLREQNAEYWCIW